MILSKKKMKKSKLSFIAISVGLLSSFGAFAERPLDAPKKNPKPSIAGCATPNSKAELDINNVRTTLLDAADFWWDGTNAKYEIPKISDADRDKSPSKNSLFSGNIWVGGLNNGQNLLVAAHTYRQGSNIDFWSGPLKPNGGGIDANECSQFDKHFKVNQSEVADFIANLDSTGKVLPGYSIPQSIQNWPGNINLPGRTGVYAPFFDRADDKIYDPLDGDYPIYGYNSAKNAIIKPDQFIWWVQNDAGNTKNSSSSAPIYLEIQSTAFAFSTSNSLNNTTFYRHILINRSSNVSLQKTYFGVNVDADLGYAFDDYVGCDVGKSLGICYNGDDDDDAAFGGYGLNPPSIGVDFFRGPKGDNGNFLGMAKFMYYNNNSSTTGNPGSAQDFYNYLRGVWRDGTPMTYGGNGYSVSSKDTCDFMFPGFTDPKKRRLWTERTESNAPYDRRFVESTGPFTFSPGAVNEIVVGVVWARASTGGAEGSFNDLLVADNQAQDLFNKEFLLEDGPVTPDLNIIELDKKLVITLTNGTKESELYNKDVIDRDQKLRRYKFEGYKIYQLRNGSVSTSELDNEDKAKLIGIFDKKNNILKAFNLEYNPEVDANQLALKAFSTDKGIQHVLPFTLDAFNSNTPISNYKPYYFTIVSYAFCDTSSEQYLQGRLNVKPYQAIPHANTMQKNGSILNSDFGDGPKITRLKGTGNGGNFLDFVDGTREAIMASPTNSLLNVEYKNGKGPVSIKVLEPNKLPGKDHVFDLKLNSTLTGWTLTDLLTNEKFESDVKTGLTDNEQIIAKYGFSIKVLSTPGPGLNIVEDKENSLISAEISYADPSNPWFDQLPNCKQGQTRDPSVPSGVNCNWIVNQAKNIVPASKYDPNQDVDPLDNWLSILGGKFAAFYQVRDGNLSFAPSPFKSVNSDFSSTPNVDLVLTADKSLWTKCVVVETEDGTIVNTVGKQFKGNIRVDSIDGMAKGFGYFPGYAINVETGQRLNVFFGEGSSQINDNGADMLFNPTNDIFDVVGTKTPNGGKHYIYIHNSSYDGCDSIYKLLTKGGYNKKNNAERAKVYNKVAWCTIPLCNPTTFNEDLKNTCTVKLRAKQPYKPYPTATDYPQYQFNFGDLASVSENGEALKSAMDKIGVSPNPYYGFSAYEASELDSRVKIINVPGTCTVSIYTTSGVLIRKLSKGDDSQTFIDWDLRNKDGVPVASGIYLFNIRATINGKPYDKVVKWFGVARQIDLNTF